jgi:hypothetical protein
MAFMKPEIPESGLRGQAQLGFWALGDPSGIQLNRYFATRSTYKRVCCRDVNAASIPNACTFCRHDGALAELYSLGL